MTHDAQSSLQRSPRALAAWARLVIVVVARGGIAGLAGFALWAAGPALLGWHVTTVVSDSMQPAIATGDVVAARPVSAGALEVGQVLLAHDPDRSDRLRLHRLESIGAHGALVTRGDANPQSDSSPVVASDVLGVGVLRVPWMGLPVVWAQQGQWPALLIAGGLLAGMLLVGTRAAVRDDERDDDGSSDDDDAASGEAATPDRAEPRRDGLRRRGPTVVAVVLAATILPIAAPPVLAHAAFSASTGQHATLTTAVAIAPSQLRCVDGPDATVTISWEHPGDVAGFTTVVDGVDGDVLAPDARSVTLSQRDLFAWSFQSVAIRADLGGSWTASSPTVRLFVFSFFGLGTVRCA